MNLIEYANAEIERLGSIAEHYLEDVDMTEDGGHNTPKHRKLVVTVGRRSGPCTDTSGVFETEASDLPAIEKTIAAVNLATRNKEGWNIIVEHRA